MIDVSSLQVKRAAQSPGALIRWYDPLESWRRAGEDLSLPEDLGDEDLSNNEAPVASDAHSLKVATPTRQLAACCIFNIVLNIRTGRRTAIISFRGKLGLP